MGLRPTLVNRNHRHSDRRGAESFQGLNDWYQRVHDFVVVVGICGLLQQSAFQEKAGNTEDVEVINSNNVDGQMADAIHERPSRVAPVMTVKLI